MPRRRKINISPLGKCRNISDILEGRNISIKEENLFYLAANNGGKIEKNGYKLDIYKLNDTKLQSHNMRKSKLYIPISCIERMNKNSEHLLDKDKGIIIIVQDFNNLNNNNISDEFFIILYNIQKTQTKYINSKDFDFSVCHEDPILYYNEIEIDYLKYKDDEKRKIDINKILYGRKFKIDLFNPYSDFLNDICIKFTSEKGTDVPLESRVEDYYQNITFCNDTDNSHYISYNYSDSKKTITYRCAFGFYKNDKDKSSYLDVVDNKLKSFGTVSNIKVITCFRQFLNLRDLIKNYGGIVFFGVLFYQIVCFLIYCYLGINAIKHKVDNLFELGRKIVNRLSNLDVHLDVGKDINDDQSNEQIIKSSKIELNQNNKDINTLKLNHAHPPKKIHLSNSKKETKKEVKQEAKKEIKKEAQEIDIQIYNKKYKIKDKKNGINIDEKEENTSNNQSARLKLAPLKESPKLDNQENKDKKSENSQITYIIFNYIICIIK